MIIGILLAMAAGAALLVTTAPFWIFIFGTVATTLAFGCAFVMSFLI
jgi:hypothetical protein